MIKKETLVIISSTYPYGKSETFLENEVYFLANFFDIVILPIKKKNKNDHPRSLPQGVTYFKPVINEINWIRLFRGIFNFSPLIPYLKDLRPLLKNSKNKKISFKKWFLRLTTNRTIASSTVFKSFLKDNSIKYIYFYWATFPIGLISYSDKKIFIRIHGGEANLKRNYEFIPLMNYIFIKKDNITYLPISVNAIQLISKFKSVKKSLNRLGVYDHGLNYVSEYDENVMIVSCSNIIKLKRIDLIIQALMNVKIKVKWVHFGDGPLMNEIVELSKQLPQNVMVEFKGKVENKKVLGFYKSMFVDLFINVSETEGVPVSIMEALSFGIPCFATDVGGTSEIVNNNLGLLVNENFNVEVLSDFISNIKEYSEQYKLRKNARMQWSNLYDAEKNYFELTQILKNS